MLEMRPISSLRHQARHHRIVEDDREFRRHRGEREEAAPTSEQVEPGAANQSSAQADDLDRRRKSAIHGLRGAGLVGDRAEHRRQHGDDEAGGGDAVAPGRLAGGRIARHARDEIGAEDEGGDDREERLRRPVEEHPAPDAAPDAAAALPLPSSAMSPSRDLHGPNGSILQLGSVAMTGSAPSRLRCMLRCDGSQRSASSGQIAHQPRRHRQPRHGDVAAFGQRLQPLADARDALAAGLQPGGDRIGGLAVSWSAPPPRCRAGPRRSCRWRVTAPAGRNSPTA